MNTLKIGGVISKARKDKDMTQMALADAMFVSYQAVSSWERGLTMPDILNLPRLSELLGLSLDELLCFDQGNPVIKRVLNPKSSLENVSIEDIEGAAPIISTDQIDEAIGFLEGDLDLEAIISLAPFASSLTLKNLMVHWLEENSHETLDQRIFDLAPFLDSASLELCIERFDLEENHAILFGYAPFLSSSKIEALLDRAIENGVDYGLMNGIVPFANSKTVDKIATFLLENEEDALTSLLPFMNAASLRKFSALAYDKNGIEGIVDYGPFLASEDLIKYMKDALSLKGFKAIQPLLPFVNSKGIDHILNSMVK